MRAGAGSGRPAWLSPVATPRTKTAHSTRPSALLDQPQEFLAAAAPLLRFATARFATTAPRPPQSTSPADYRPHVTAQLSPLADHAHFGFQSHSALFLNPAARELDQSPHAFAARAAHVDDKIR